MLKYKISEAAILPTSTFSVPQHWAQCPQPKKNTKQKHSFLKYVHYLWTYAMASKNKTSLLWDTALFLERAMSLIYINYSLNSSLLYIKPLHLMLANTLLFPWGETHHVYQVIVILYLHFTQHCSLLHLWNYFYWFTTKRQVKKNEENVEDSKVNGFILYKRIVCNFKKIQTVNNI